MNKIIYTKWLIEYQCKECGNILTYSEKMHSNGVCSFCGANSHNTVVDTNEKSIRYVVNCVSDWWQFWKKDIITKEYFKE